LFYLFYEERKKMYSHDAQMRRLEQESQAWDENHKKIVITAMAIIGGFGIGAVPVAFFSSAAYAIVLSGALGSTVTLGITCCCVIRDNRCGFFAHSASSEQTPLNLENNSPSLGYQK
jgi:Na+(H+)/acetate symporter ActP